MIERFREVSLNLLLGYGLAALSEWLQSPFLNKFLSENLIVVVVALLAINTTTSSVVMTKLREIADETGADFSRTVRELRRSITEQVYYIVIATMGSILYSSDWIKDLVPWPNLIIGGLLASVFVAALFTLYDTGASIFIILRHEEKKQATSNDQGS